jgi:hypothetical protein
MKAYGGVEYNEGIWRSGGITPVLLTYRDSTPGTHCMMLGGPQSQSGRYLKSNISALSGSELPWSSS